MVFVGKYDVNDLRSGKDKAEFQKTKEETGLKYLRTKVVKEKGKQYLKLWLLTDEEYYNSPLI